MFDNSDLSPLAGAQVEVQGNQTLLASSRAGSDGVVGVSFLYRAGSWVIITASKQDYITNSVPWHSNRIPCKSSAVTVYFRWRCWCVSLQCQLSYNVCFSVRLGQPVPPRREAGNPHPVR